MSSLKAGRLALCAALVGLGLCAGVAPSGASEITGSIPTSTGAASGLPLPRFVSLKGSQVNLRIGPGINFPVEWRYLRSGVPMEIIQEYDNWRRVRDAEGAEGWINQSLLTGRRTAIAAPWQRGKEVALALRAEPAESGRIAARIEPGVIGTLRTCNGQWCEMEVSGHRGWIRQALIWGAYPGETYKD